MVAKTHKFNEYAALLLSKGLAVEINASYDELERIVGHISFDSNDIEENTLFICKGEHFSEKYLKDALSKGAFAYVSEKKYQLSGMNSPYAIVGRIRRAMAEISGFYYGGAWDHLNIAGITGTKGKSTTVYFVKCALDHYLSSLGKHRSAYVSSIDTYDGVVEEESRLTTPEIMTLHKHFDNAVNSGIEYLTMEVSSQALKYERVLGVLFDVACFLNIGEDHISSIEHVDFEDYFSSKLSIFDQCKSACVNMDSDSADRILNQARLRSPKVATFGLTERADVHGYDVKASESGIAFRAKCSSFDSEFKISMNGLFNVQNALAAIAVCCELGVPAKHIRAGLENAKVSGRMEVFKGRGLTVIVDYAHNKMSFEALFASVRQEFPGKRISIVFGCPGGKAQGRRRELGETAGSCADRVFVTEEDPGEEPLAAISEEIAGHVRKAGCACEIIADRGDAIKAAIDTASEGSVVLVTGKGRETRQKRGIVYVPVPSDADYVEECLK
ncbi:MAG: UDP-N-acetylmuramoyl-L-alanyl-D-glutamate--2,6-diaminopimelate ligase [Clostridiales bacterium]|nr:UDP-N-acetylmuramoyl-L-alanyl-D-glutamate--2,6-diaminopimelate ligase [Clostridiales bacterium]